MMTIDEILAAFESYDGTYKRAAVDAAIAQRDAIIPHLITVLENLASDPETYSTDPDYYAPVYASMLLGHFRAVEAHPAILQVFSLPKPYPENMFGDIITENLPAILTLTCDGDLSGIRALATNPNAYLFCRGSATQSLTFAVVQGWISREEVLQWLVDFYKVEDPKAVTDEDREFFISVGYSLCDMHPVEVMDTIRQAFDDGVLEDDFMLAQEDFETAIKGSQEAAFERLQENFERNALKDIHNAMEWWASFQPQPKVKPSKPLTPRPAPKPMKIKKKKNFWDL
jgi:hypothetical protein